MLTFFSLLHIIPEILYRIYVGVIWFSDEHTARVLWIIILPNDKLLLLRLKNMRFTFWFIQQDRERCGYQAVWALKWSSDYSGVITIFFFFIFFRFTSIFHLHTLQSMISQYETCHTVKQTTLRFPSLFFTVPLLRLSAHKLPFGI